MQGALFLRVQAGAAVGSGIALVPNRPVTIGRGDGESLTLQDSAVSRHHLTVHAEMTEPPSLVVDEVAGINPAWTMFGGKRQELRMGSRIALSASFTLGNTTIGFVAETPQVASRPPTPGLAKNTVEVDARVLRQTHSASRLGALAALGERLSRCGSVQAVLRTATEWAIEAMPARRAFLLSPDGTDVLAAASDRNPGDLAISRGLLARTLQEERAFLVRDVLSEPDLANRQSVMARGTQGAMAVPTSSLVFYCDWGVHEAARGRHDETTLNLLICAAQLVSALSRNAAEKRELAVAHKDGGSGPQIIGNSPAVERLHVFLERVAGSPTTVLLNGESGTGKELAARTIHALSPRSSAPCVAINCAAIPQNLLESELFGHEKGAFTGAVEQHLGVFERANGGTLFLDEIGEMSHPTQARMLRVLENQTFTRVGGSKEVQVDVRVVAATHRDLRQMVAEGSFREDLLYRLSVIQTNLPPLRERTEDIERLVLHFTESLGDAMGRRIGSIHPDALAVLMRYRWPGNVRELRNVVERALVLGDGPVLEVDDLPPELLHQAPTDAPAPFAPEGTVLPLAELERRGIAAALTATDGNKARAAALLGIDRSTLYRKLKELEP